MKLIPKAIILLLCNYVIECTASEESGVADLGSDTIEHVEGGVRRKRYVVRKKRWRTNKLTWKLDTRNINEGDEYIMRNTLHRAFHLWEAVSSVQLREEYEGDTDITVAFERGRHEDAFPFDGKDGVVAHAFYPRDGRLHFDSDEDWTLNSYSGVNLFQTAVHEIGHLLGLEHSLDPRSAMFAAKKSYDPEFKLADDDVRAIRVLFPIGGQLPSLGSKLWENGEKQMKVTEIVENLKGKRREQEALTLQERMQFPFGLPILMETKDQFNL